MSNREKSDCEWCTSATTLTEDELIEMCEGRDDHHSLAFILLPYLRAGRLDEARRAHLRGYRVYLRERGTDGHTHPQMLAQHVLFCALTGNLARGVSLLESHFADLLGEADAVGVLLGRAIDAGHGEEALRVPIDVAFTLELTAPVTVASVSKALQQTRDELRTVHYDVTLSTLPRPRPPVTRLDLVLPGTAEGWLERCDDLAELHEYESAYRALRNALALDPEPVLRAEALGYRVRLLSELERREEIPPLIAERAALLRDLGEEDHAGWLERSAQLAVQPLTGDEVALAEALVAEYDRPEVPLRIRAMPRLLLGHVLLYALRAEEAVSELRVGVEHA
nr:hypothetical protein [Longispora sp. (in: high G+C Gram-positive bacteria)]